MSQDAAAPPIEVHCPNPKCARVHRVKHKYGGMRGKRTTSGKSRGDRERRQAWGEGGWGGEGGPGVGGEQPRRKRRWGRIIGFTALGLVLVLLAGGVASWFWASSKITHVGAVPSDAGPPAHIRQALIELSRSGSAVLLISQDLDELFEISDAIAVMQNGELSKPMPIAEATFEKVGLLMGGAEPGHAEHTLETA